MCAAKISGSKLRRQTGRAGVSVIIPVHNAVLTLAATLDSVVGQTHTDWEAVIVDDGSSDDTRAIVADWVHKDSRFRTLHQKKSGVSAARNRGLDEAKYPYVLFLDGDDRIAPTYLECMARKLMTNSSLDAVHCAWQFILPSGAAGRVRQSSPEVDLFEYFAWYCHFPIHTCVLKRELALAVGGFDPSLITCEDWDFFQRVARTGARFGRVSEVLAFYHIRPDSASQDNRRCVTDARVVIDRGHGRDPRMRVVAEVHAEGRLPASRDLALYYLVTYFAAKETTTGRDALDFLDIGDLPSAPGLSPAVVAAFVQEALLMTANQSEEEWSALWSRVRAPLTRFLGKLEAQTRAPALAFATLQHLGNEGLLTDPSSGPLLVGSTYRVDVDLTKHVSDVFLPPEADRLICRLKLKGELIGAIELPGNGVVAGRAIAKAAVEGHGRLLLRNALTLGQAGYLGLRTVRCLLRRRTLRLLYNVLAAKHKDRLDVAVLLRQEAASALKASLPTILAKRPGPAARQAERQLQERLSAVAAACRTQVREKLGPHQNHEEWDRRFALPDPWGYDSEYEELKYAQTLAYLPEGAITDALEIGCAEGHFTVRLARRVVHLTAVDISPRALARAQERCAGHANVAFQRLDLNAGDIPGPFDLIVCSEVLYYVRDLPGVVSRILSQVRPGGFFLTSHSRVLVDDPEGVGFDWNHPFGVETIANAIAAVPEVALRKELRTPVYRVLLYQRLAPDQQPCPAEIAESRCVGRMTPVAEEPVKWPGRQPPKLAVPRAYSAPILMYHRIATVGPDGLERYRVAPDLFAAQMTALHRAGYRTMRLGEWASAMARLQPVRGKPVVLTFDDGYRDFLTAAMPVLRAHGFLATVFLVAERIGETALWDAGFGEPAPLLSWEEVRALQEVGVEFGCHSLAHRPLTGMGLAELTEDTVRARAILEEGLAAPITTLAYPYGAENDFVRCVVGDLGFLAAVTCESGISRLRDDPLRLRRIEVPGDRTPEQLLALIDHAP